MKPKYILFIIIFSLCAIALAHPWTKCVEQVNGLQWHYTVENDEAILGIRLEYLPALDKVAQGEIVVPDFLGGYPVRTIAPNAFDNQTAMTAIALPTGLLSICHHTFEGCTNLTTVSMPITITNIENSAFSQCEKLSNIVIPEGITKIESSTFFSTSLESVELPSTIETIGEFAFSDCKKLKNIILPEGLKQIKWGAFARCESLTHIEIPSSVTNIEAGAFVQCRSLKSITIPSGVLSLGQKNCQGVFDYCTSLTNITLSEGLKYISRDNFTSCNSLKSIIIPDSVTNIALRAFIGCNLETIVVGSGVQTIEEVAFADNENLKLIEFRGNAPTFGNRVFCGPWGFGAPTNCVFRIHRGTTGWNIIEPSSTNESPRIQFDGCSFPVEYVADISDEE